MINVFQPSLGIEELMAVAETFKSGWIGKGQRVTEFESQFAQYLEVEPGNIVSTNSCTEALFQIMELIDVRGKEVIIPSIHFIGAANAIIANGGRPVFCDVDFKTLNTSIEYIEPLITSNTKAIVLLHYGGYPCDIQPVLDLADQRGIIVIEDAATALGASYRGQACGTLADYGVWSLDAMKTISCGDGGMIYAKDSYQIDELKIRLNLGMNQPAGLLSENIKWWEFESVHPARRSIMNDIAASIGIEQLKKLPDFLGIRGMWSMLYSEKLGYLNQESGLVLLPASSDLRINCISACYFYWLQTPTRDELALWLRKNDIYTTFKYYPLHKALGIKADLPNTEKAASETLLLPLHTGLRYHDVEYICELIQAFSNDI